MSLSLGNQPVDFKYYLTSIASNKQKLQRFQDVMSLSLGIAAGVLGLESFHGVGFYCAGTFASNLCFLSLCCPGDPKNFFVSPLQNVIFDGLLTNVAGYVMMWCLTYALVK